MTKTLRNKYASRDIIVKPSLKKDFDKELKTRKRLKQKVNESQEATTIKLKSLSSGQLVKSIKTDIPLVEILNRSQDLIVKPKLYWQCVPGPDLRFKYHLVVPFSYKDTNYELALRLNKNTQTESNIQVDAFSSKIKWHSYCGDGPYSPHIYLEDLAKEVPGRIIFSALESALQERLNQIKNQNTSLQDFLTDGYQSKKLKKGEIERYG